MATQQVLIVTPVALFEITSDGKTKDRGNSQCAVVGVPTTPPKFSLVCYNAQKETLCICPIQGSNEQSLQFTVTAGDYATFRDGRANKWSMMFLKSTHVDKFVAVIGACTFGAAGQPTHAPTIVDVSPPSGEERLSLTHRAKVEYSAFAIRKMVQPSGSLPLVEDLVETNGDRAYEFQPVQSTMALLPEARGFESSMLGSVEDGRRVVIVPAEMPRSNKTLYPSHFALAYVVHVRRILHGETPMGDVAPVVFGSGSDHGALVTMAQVSHERSMHSDPMTASDGLHRFNESVPMTGHVGRGIPAEHMAMLQRISATFNTLSTAFRDLHDRIGHFEQDWKSEVERPKPSVLTPAALEQQVKNLIQEHDRLKDETQRRDELINSLDQRNRDLQRRADKAAMVAQQMLDEKQKTIENTSDLRLEKDRIVTKLQEDINRVTMERDDVQRHLQTVKKLLEESDKNLKDIKGKAEIQIVQAQGLETKLEATEEQRGQERTRRKALESKVAHLQEEIREAEAELHVKEAQLEEVRRRADMERAHQAKLTEDERVRRSYEAQQLRNEIIDELQNKENTFQADRLRTAEEFFQRGRAEGKVVGRREARIEIETRLQDLSMGAQRAERELENTKSDLHRINLEGLAETRRLESAARDLKHRLEDVAKRKAEASAELQSIALKTRHAADNVVLALTNVAHQLTGPLPLSELRVLLQSVLAGAEPSLAFQEKLQAQEWKECQAFRTTCMQDALISAYEKKQEKEWAQHVPQLEKAIKTTTEEVMKLIKEREENIAGELYLEETSARYDITSEEKQWFQSVLNFFRELVDEQKKMVDDEVVQRQAICVEEEPFWNALEQWWTEEQSARDALVEDENKSREGLVCAEAKAFDDIQKELEWKLGEFTRDAQEEIIGAENIGRTEIELEENDTIDWHLARFHGDRLRLQLVATEEVVRATELVEAEEKEREILLSVVATTLEEADRAFAAAVAAEQYQREAANKALMHEEEEQGRLANYAADASKIAPPPMPDEAWGDPIETQQPKKKRSHAVKVEATDDEVDPEEDAEPAEDAEGEWEEEYAEEAAEADQDEVWGDEEWEEEAEAEEVAAEDAEEAGEEGWEEEEEEEEEAIEPPQKSAKKGSTTKSSAFKFAEDDDDGDFDDKPPAKASAKDKKQFFAASTSKSKKSKKDEEEDDWDDEEHDAVSSKKTAATSSKPAPAKAPANNKKNLFADSSDDDSSAAFAPKAAPSKATQKLPARAKPSLFADSSDDD